VIAHSLPGYNESFLERLKASEPDFPLEHFYRQPERFTMDILSEKDQEIVRGHDPMRQNPFLVVYMFKE
jgi:hypothetical protein